MRLRVLGEAVGRQIASASELNEAADFDAVKAHLEHEGSRLVLHHGPTEDALLRAEELRAWLTALALESSRMTLQNDLGAGDPLRIEVVPHEGP